MLSDSVLVMRNICSGKVLISCEFESAPQKFGRLYDQPRDVLNFSTSLSRYGSAIFKEFSIH